MLFNTQNASATIDRRVRRVNDLEGLSSADLKERCDAILRATEQAVRDEELARREHPIIRLFSSEWDLTHVVQNPLDYTFEWVYNDTGTAETKHLAESPEAKWLIDIQKRVDNDEGEAPFIVVDYVGGRWSGCLEDVEIEETEEGDAIVTATWLHDYEQLKWVLCWPTPFLPAFIQFKVWLLAGPADWCAGTTLFFNLWRLNQSLLTFPDDPLDLEQWTDDWDVGEWPIAVNPKSFIECMSDGTLWALPIIRMKTWHEAFEPILADAEIMVQCDRWLEGDDLPWEGANPRNGQLIVSFVNKSGRFTGTSQGGNLFGGLKATFEQFGEDFIDTTISAITGVPMPSDYLQIGVKSTRREMPYAILRPGVTPGVLSARMKITPAKAVQFVTGGHSMPGVNEVISAIIQAIGDIVGDNLTVAGYGVGSIGGTIDTILKPLYEDVILAWTATKSFKRGQNAGWSRYEEMFQEGADQAYTLSSLMVIRTALWATRRKYRHSIKIIDASPWMLGDNGVGHIWLGSRVGSTLPRDESGKVWVDQIMKLVLTASEEDFHPEWDITIGGDIDEDPFMKAMERIKSLTSGLRSLGLV